MPKSLKGQSRRSGCDFSGPFGILRSRRRQIQQKTERSQETADIQYSVPVTSVQRHFALEQPHLCSSSDSRDVLRLSSVIR